MSEHSDPLFGDVCFRLRGAIQVLQGLERALRLSRFIVKGYRGKVSNHGMRSWIEFMGAV